MRKIYLLLCFIGIGFLVNAQVRWDRGGNSSDWNNPLNWDNDQVPGTNDDVLLDNSFFANDYTVILPSTAVTTTIGTLTITPTAGQMITLVIPSTNTADPGLQVQLQTIIGNGGILLNSTGVGAGGTGLTTTSLRINNGGHYIHNNERSHVDLVANLSTAAGTENGIFEFDVPTSGGYTVSFSNRDYGDLVFSATASGGAQTYSGSGASDLDIRGNLTINTGATVTSTMTANINIAGNFTLDGTMNNNPASGGANRGIVFNGTANQTVSGAGTLSFNANSNGMVVNGGATITLQKDIDLPNAANGFVVNSGGTLQTGTNIISGAAGFFTLNSGGTLGIGSPDGVTAASASGNIQTATRTFNTGANYEYNGAAAQATGDGLPITVNNLTVNNGNDVTLTTATTVNGVLTLTAGKLNTTTTNLLTLSATGTVSSGAHGYTQLPYTNMGTATSYIVGPMAKAGLNNTASFAFPVGDAALHRPVILKDATGDFTVTYVGQSPRVAYGNDLGAGLHHISDLEHWTIDATGATATVELTFYDPNSGGVTDLADLRVARHDGAQWVNEGNSASIGTAGSNGTVTSNAGLTNFSPFSLASATSNNPLPIFLQHFNVQVVSSYANAIKWSINNDNQYQTYILEKSYDNNNFASVYTVPSKQSTTIAWYSYNDNEDKSCYYRLKLISKSGKALYSNVLSAMKDSPIYSVFPGLATDKINVTMPSSISHLQIVNNIGQIVKQLKVPNQSPIYNIDITSLHKGVYFIKFIDKQTVVQSQRFVKQ